MEEQINFVMTYLNKYENFMKDIKNTSMLYNFFDYFLLFFLFIFNFFITKYVIISLSELFQFSIKK